MRLFSFPSVKKKKIIDFATAVRDHVDGVYTVSEAQIVAAMKLVFERMKLVIEPSAAVGVAVALFSDEFRARNGVKNVGVVLCGGNVDLDHLPWLASPPAK